jgi:hypothetical protein
VACIHELAHGFQASAEETRNGAQIISFGYGIGDHRWTGRGVQIGGYSLVASERVGRAM